MSSNEYRKARTRFSSMSDHRLSVRICINIGKSRATASGSSRRDRRKSPDEERTESRTRAASHTTSSPSGFRASPVAVMYSPGPSPCRPTVDVRIPSRS
jgi:hypothetical protein